MVLVGDTNSIFNAGLILGCTALCTSKDNVKARRLRDIIFIVFSMTLYLVSFVVMYIYVFSYEDSDLKSMLIVIIRVFLIYLCLFTDASVTTLWNWKIRSVLSQLRNFDRATKFRDFSKGNKLRIICHVTVFVSFSYWAIVGYFTYR